MSDLTFGQQAVGLTFNPSGDQTVVDLKQSIADLIDIMNTMRDSATDQEVKRLCSVAITEAQTAQMWAVKAATWGRGQVTSADPANTDTDNDNDAATEATPAEASTDTATPAAPATPAADVVDPAPQQPNATPSA